jgi:4-diphosphocytidyl-2-C-methyl-D-erythritol kinase
MTALTIKAHAKLNLYLEVLGRREDGFHRLETVFQTIGLHDELEVSLGPAGTGIQLTCDDPSLPVDGRNLVWRAAAAFIEGRRAEVGGIVMRLRKRIPHGAGLGGGSSDAAAALRGLDRLLPGWHDEPGLLRLAAVLGSDVPFFLMGGTALGEERGEVLTPLPPLLPRPVTILMPAARLATPAVFKELSDEERGPRPGRGREWWRARLVGGGWPTDLLFNRLGPPAARLCPELADLLQWLGRQGVPYLMSGSGAACFAFGELAAPPGVATWVTTLVPGPLAVS